VRPHLVAETARRGIITRTQALRLVPEHVLDDAIADCVLTRIFPKVYCLPEQARDRTIRRRGALAHRPRTALSAIDALDVWSCFPFPIPAAERIHVTGNRRESKSKWPDLTVHRQAGFALKAPLVWETQGLHVVRLEQAIVDSWTMLPERDRRVPAITAIRERRTTGLLLLEVLALNSRATGAAEMRRVFGVASAGVHSPLELWGHDHVFSHAGMPTSTCQVPIKLPFGTIYLDRYFEEERLAVEMDGAAFHGSPGQRERDIRRDAALAAKGIQVVRFSHQRLYADPEGVRRELLAILAARRRLLGLSA